MKIARKSKQKHIDNAKNQMNRFKLFIDTCKAEGKPKFTEKEEKMLFATGPESKVVEAAKMSGKPQKKVSFVPELDESISGESVSVAEPSKKRRGRPRKNIEEEKLNDMSTVNVKKTLS